MTIAQIGRGPRTDDTISWLADKPLPEDPRWPEGSVLSDLVDIARVGNWWVLSAPGRLDVDELYARNVLVEEIHDAIEIHDSMLAHIDGEDAIDTRKARRVLVRLLDAIKNGASC